jgi:hypothetical protein
LGVDEKLEAYRLRAKTDYLFLGCDVLGFDFQPNPHAGLFREFLTMQPGVPLYDLDREIKKRMILWPRGTFKTSAIIVVMVILILNYPDISLLFWTGSRQLAKRQLARVKRVFEKPTKKFKALFPEFCGKKLGSAEEFTIPNRVSTVMAEPTVALTTSKSVKAGSHFHAGFIDDLVNDQNYQHDQLLEQCWEDFKQIGPMIQPAGFIFVTGTRYSFGDTYERIQERARQEMTEIGKTVWKFSIRTCWVRICATCGSPDALHDFDKFGSVPPCPGEGDGHRTWSDSGQKKVLFPRFTTKDGRTEGHTVEFLESERREKGDEFFGAQYENNPIASGTQTFTVDLLNRQTLWHLSQIPQSGSTFIVGDLSYVGDCKRDQTVLDVCRLRDGQIFQFDCVAGKFTTEGHTVELFKLVQKHRPRIIWLEKFLGWEAYQSFFTAYAIQHKVQHLPIEWFPMSNVEDAKLKRIGAVQAVFAQRRLWLFAGAPHYEEKIKQLKRFPKIGKYKDFADNLGHICGLPTGYQMTPVPEKNPLPDFIQQTLKPKAEEIRADGPLGSCLVG